MNFQRVKLFEIKKSAKPVKSRFGGLFTYTRNLFASDAKVESENEIFIKQKHRGNITAKNKNSHLLRNFISTIATKFVSFKYLLDGLQFALFGVSNENLAKEILGELKLDGKEFSSLLSRELFGNGEWLKGW